ncbi:hypothetical protein QWI30_29245 [Citrobacter freundii]|nr:hypothetical protein [Citrobacter freundii]
MTRTDINNYQKASVERTNPQNAWVMLAAAPRRSYLGKYRRLTPSQSRWVRSLLNHWGGMYGGQRNRAPFWWRWYVVNDIDRLDWRAAGADRYRAVWPA